MPYFSAEVFEVVSNRRQSFSRILHGIQIHDNDDLNRAGVQCASTLDEYCRSYLPESALALHNQSQVIGRFLVKKEQEQIKIFAEHSKIRLRGQDQLQKLRAKTSILMVPQIWILRAHDMFITAMH